MECNCRFEYIQKDMGVNLIVDLILKKYGGSVDLNMYKNMEVV